MYLYLRVRCSELETVLQSESCNLSSKLQPYTDSLCTIRCLLCMLNRLQDSIISRIEEASTAFRRPHFAVPFPNISTHRIHEVDPSVTTNAQRLYKTS